MHRDLWLYVFERIFSFCAINPEGKMAKAQDLLNRTRRERKMRAKKKKRRDTKRTHLIRTHAMILKQNMEYLMVDI